jgi:hypothetical protein
MIMPVVRYIAWVGASLLALLFIVDWYLPRSLPEPVGDPVDRPIIRITSIQQLPERVVFDTSQPTIVPSPALVGPTIPDEPSPPQSYASAPPPPTIVDAEKKARKAVKRQGSKAVATQNAVANQKTATNQPPLTSTPAVASGSSSGTAPPTRLSFADIVSGQLVRNLFNLR